MAREVSVCLTVMADKYICEMSHYQLISTTFFH